jgi:hypothetical protein
VYFHNAGALLLQLYKLVSPFIDPRTREKVVFLPNDAAEAAAVLAKDIDVSVRARARARALNFCASLQG